MGLKGRDDFGEFWSLLSVAGLACASPGLGQNYGDLIVGDH